MIENYKMSKDIVHYGGSAAIPRHLSSAGIPKIRYGIKCGWMMDGWMVDRGSKTPNENCIPVDSILHSRRI
jgi:hypothetical protein